LEHGRTTKLTSVGIALVLVTVFAAVPVASFSSVCVPQAFPSLLSLAMVNVQQPGPSADFGQQATMPGLSRSNLQRWYISFLTQQKVISGQVDDLRNLLRENLITPEQFLQRLDSLLSRADRLYSQWKRVNTNGAGGCGSSTATITSDTSEMNRNGARQNRPPARDKENDLAVGKCLNYLRLSILNFFLGYSDSNGRQIDDAETQVTLSRVWHSRSLSFIMAPGEAPNRAAPERAPNRPAS
jgi:hypothetical protein